MKKKQNTEWKRPSPESSVGWRRRIPGNRVKSLHRVGYTCQRIATERPNKPTGLTRRISTRERYYKGFAGSISRQRHPFYGLKQRNLRGRYRRNVHSPFHSVCEPKPYFFAAAVAKATPPAEKWLPLSKRYYFNAQTTAALCEPSLRPLELCVIIFW